MQEERKSVRFSDVIRYSDNRIGYLKYEEEEEVLSIDSHDHESSKRWNMEAHRFSPSLPLRRQSFLLTDCDGASQNPPSPPLRKRSIILTSPAPSAMPESALEQHMLRTTKRKPRVNPKFNPTPDFE